MQEPLWQSLFQSIFLKLQCQHKLSKTYVNINNKINNKLAIIAKNNIKKKIINNNNVNNNVRNIYKNINNGISATILVKLLHKKLLYSNNFIHLDFYTQIFLQLKNMGQFIIVLTNRKQEKDPIAALPSCVLSNDWLLPIPCQLHQVYFDDCSSGNPGGGQHGIEKINLK